MTDWQEVYFDLLNKVECECVQQGDLVPIWDQFKRMNLTIIKLQGNQASLETEIRRLRQELEQLEVDAMEHYNDFHEAGCDQKSAIDLAFAVASYCRQALTPELFGKTGELP